MTHEETVALLVEKNYSSNDYNFTKEEKEALNSFFNQHIRKKHEWTELKNKIGEKEYVKLVGFVKEKYKEYFDFATIAESNPNDLEIIFKSCVVFFDKNEYKKVKDKYSEETVRGVLSVFGRVLDFCVDNGLSKNAMKDILIEHYDCPKELAGSISDYFQDNRLYLMLYKLLPNDRTKNKQ